MSDRIILTQRDNYVETRCSTERYVSATDSWVEYSLWKTVTEKFTVDECRKNHERLAANEPEHKLRFVVQDTQINSVTTIKVED